MFGFSLYLGVALFGVLGIALLLIVLVGFVLVFFLALFGLFVYYRNLVCLADLVWWFGCDAGLVVLMLVAWLFVCLVVFG